MEQKEQRKITMKEKKRGKRLKLLSKNGIKKNKNMNRKKEYEREQEIM